MPAITGATSATRTTVRTMNHDPFFNHKRWRHFQPTPPHPSTGGLSALLNAIEESNHVDAVPRPKTASPMSIASLISPSPVMEEMDLTPDEYAIASLLATTRSAAASSTVKRQRSSPPSSIWSSEEETEEGEDDEEEAGERATKKAKYWPVANVQPVTITCMHGSVAQKSYGSEKRFLCPPPTVTVGGPLTCERVSASVGDIAQTLPLDSTHTTRFKNLHVTDKAKRFRLRLDLTEDLRVQTGPITIISKPSKKSASISSSSTSSSAARGSLPMGSQIALFNRINSQTVRTKFVKMSAGGQLVVSAAGWSALTLHGRGESLVYGTEVVLQCEGAEMHVRVRKVERGAVKDAWGPVGQMHKVALESVANPGEFFTANVPVGNISSCSGEDEEDRAGSWLNLATLKTTKSTTDESGISVPDVACWTIVGVSRSERVVYPSAGSSLEEKNVRIDGQAVDLSLDSPLASQIDRAWFGKWGPLPLQVLGNGAVRIELPDSQEILKEASGDFRSVAGSISISTSNGDQLEVARMVCCEENNEVWWEKE
ncbi:uncharacterized protein VTP21DRAFT_9373 [Calcarisporiella thermophila]|uniref:uncharacterized protein n=1 Tax=Calcarisporiella thermophila TaxID=911321 RepID=UPI003742C1AB